MLKIDIYAPLNLLYLGMAKREKTLRFILILRCVTPTMLQLTRTKVRMVIHA